MVARSPAPAETMHEKHRAERADQPRRGRHRIRRQRHRGGRRTREALALEVDAYHPRCVSSSRMVRSRHMAVAPAPTTQDRDQGALEVRIAQPVPEKSRGTDVGQQDVGLNHRPWDRHQHPGSVDTRATNRRTSRHAGGLNMHGRVERHRRRNHCNARKLKTGSATTGRLVTATIAMARRTSWIRAGPLGEWPR